MAFWSGWEIVFYDARGFFFSLFLVFFLGVFVGVLWVFLVFFVVFRALARFFVCLFSHQVFYVKSAPICLRQPSRLNVILFAFPDHSRTEKVSDVSCLSRGLRRAPVSDEAPR